MEFAHRFSINKENNPGPEVPRSNRVLEIEKVIGFLNLFSIIWLLEGKIWKSIKAFVAAGWLFLEKRRYGQRAVLLTKPMNMSVFENDICRSIQISISPRHPKNSGRDGERCQQLIYFLHTEQ